MPLLDLYTEAERVGIDFIITAYMINSVFGKILRKIKNYFA